MFGPKFEFVIWTRVRPVAGKYPRALDEDEGVCASIA